MNDKELERIALLAEEMGEATQIIGKILRHGYNSTNPLAKYSTENREMLEAEIGHVKYAIALMEANGDLKYKNVIAHRDSKARNIVRWLHHNHVMPAFAISTPIEPNATKQAERETSATRETKNTPTQEEIEK